MNFEEFKKHDGYNALFAGGVLLVVCPFLTWRTASQGAMAGCAALSFGLYQLMSKAKATGAPTEGTKPPPDAPPAPVNVSEHEDEDAS